MGFPSVARCAFLDSTKSDIVLTLFPGNASGVQKLGVVIDNVSNVIFRRGIPPVCQMLHKLSHLSHGKYPRKLCSHTQTLWNSFPFLSSHLAAGFFSRMQLFTDWFCRFCSRQTELRTIWDARSSPAAKVDIVLPLYSPGCAYGLRFPSSLPPPPLGCKKFWKVRKFHFSRFQTCQVTLSTENMESQGQQYRNLESRNVWVYIFPTFWVTRVQKYLKSWGQCGKLEFFDFQLSGLPPSSRCKNIWKVRNFRFYFSRFLTFWVIPPPHQRLSNGSKERFIWETFQVIWKLMCHWKISTLNDCARRLSWRAADIPLESLVLHFLSKQFGKQKQKTHTDTQTRKKKIFGIGGCNSFEKQLVSNFFVDSASAPLKTSTCCIAFHP